MGRRAVVLGATGLVGRAVVERLAREPSIDSIAALTRRPVDFGSPKVENRVVDFERLEASAFAGDRLFSCLGTTRAQAGSIEAQRVVDLDYQLAAARLAAEAGIRHYLLVSSAGADARSRNPYLRMKGELEDAVRALPFERVSVFQPSLLLGARERPRLGETAASLILPALCALPGLRRWRPIRGEQVADRMVQAALGPGPARETFRLDEVFPILPSP